jgi:hypothetical protein
MHSLPNRKTGLDIAECRYAILELSALLGIAFDACASSTKGNKKIHFLVSKELVSLVLLQQQIKYNSRKGVKR